VCDIVVKKFTFAISSPDELLSFLQNNCFVLVLFCCFVPDTIITHSLIQASQHKCLTSHCDFVLHV